ncbi:hypothetical protein COU78_06470 [Candidatus Peregrinibacteria bacterium CG10_big_fil_rev_8_21_14_0_10_49_24]|nr:MAG: hypothetical protein COV83_04885 [Candidatus Peregrinibacteria bacterium CG11_big_fil_rev_8_21_14_0_20_49_14]PIR50494.1 MAG: hypothetical protein COU78_06470 [Candidatus Peregrinibacteria bacterium CG10_big_fil_rev_8_21_14_0_10_49_24]PJA67698.1 MAG: hypothetical protein CO157_03240 [Candidatus Peregrinibacteria bacterium CG_4_9_14_3_um_filter_49_12]
MGINSPFSSTLRSSLIRHHLAFPKFALAIFAILLPGKALMLTINPEPSSFSEAQGIIGTIEGDVAGAQCGGWDWDKPVLPHIAISTGLPGRDGSPLDHKPANMALRVEGGGVIDGPVANTGFKWPSTFGYTSACRPGWPPFYEAHPCQRPAGPDAGFIGPKIFKPPSIGCTFGGGVCGPDPLGNGVGWTCDALCEDLNRRWLYDQYAVYCLFPGPPPFWADTGTRINTICYDPDTQPVPAPPVPPPGCFVGYLETHYCCTNSPVGGPFPNCKSCSDDECRQELPSPGSPYKSYFRHYFGSCTRATVAAAPQDDADRIGVPVACYGLYNEYDPKLTVSGFFDRHCTIANTYPGRNHDYVDMPRTQVTDFNIAEYGQRLYGTDWPDPPSGDYQIVRNPGFNSNIDLWYPNISGGFSLINGKVFDDVYKNEFTFAIMAPDNTEFKSYPQLTEEQVFSSGAYMRAFDDTVNNDRFGRRTIAEWWQDLETESNKLFSPPHVRLILPPSWATGMDPLDPFFSPDMPDPFNPKQPSDPRMEPIEVQLEVKEDLLGEVAAYLERSLILRLQEEAVPVLIPQGSATEFRAKAQAWCAWHIASTGANNCENVGGDLGDLLTKLEAYADRLDDVRKMRGELARYEAWILEDQRDIIQTIANWLKANIDEYNAYQTSVQNLQFLKSLWQGTQRMYRTFHDKSNFPWCMSQSFTTSIYSMLDDFFWMPGRPDLTGCIDGAPSNAFNCLPRFKTDLIPDAVLDFSLIRTATGAIQLPVLKPVQVSLARYNLDPPSGRKAAQIPKLPDLPAIPTIYNDVINGLPDLVIEDPPTTIGTFIPTAIPGVDPNIYYRAFGVVSGMNSAYQKFWDSLRLDPAAVTDGTEEDCIFPDTIPCVHVEMDLTERFVRMCSRPAVFLEEDFDKEVIGRPIDEYIIDFDECPGTEDPRPQYQWNWACQPLNQEKYQTQRGWGLRSPYEKEQMEFISEFRRGMFEQTLLRDGVPEDDKLKFKVEPNDITPSFEAQGTTKVIFDTYTSSSSSSAGP